MAAPRLRAADIPTAGPWLVRGEAGEGASAGEAMLGVEPATEDRPGGWPYLIRQNRLMAAGDCPLHLATGIQRLADARLMAAAPDLAAALLRLLTSSALTKHGFDLRTVAVVMSAWEVLVRVTPHLGSGDPSTTLARSTR
ncbi:hypothetical protein [Lichenibacterium dinghuense]|uniref:hypothetical protein n=1 Tax=Lichenibacterium dinghuense TaxID=2895977 RepID=UPI001F25542F|nr:hypothetical protein [Lichenibacterium sp. 6Y81]